MIQGDSVQEGPTEGADPSSTVSAKDDVANGSKPVETDQDRVMTDQDRNTLIDRITSYDAVPPDVKVCDEISQGNLKIAYATVNEFTFGKSYKDRQQAIEACNQFGLKNGFTGRISSRNQWVCSCSSNSNYREKRSGKKTIDRKDSSMSTGCPFKVILSLKKGEINVFNLYFQTSTSPTNKLPHRFGC